VKSQEEKMTMIFEKILNSVHPLVLRILRPMAHHFSDRYHSERIQKIIALKFPNLNLTPNSLVLDLGSNRGRFARALADSRATIICFEPNPDVFSESVKLLKKFKNVFILQVAVSTKSGITKLYLHKNHKEDPIGYSISASINSKKENVSNQDFYIVPTFEFKTFIENIEKIDLLKIDIEGAEADLWKVIEMNYQKIEYLLLEPHVIEGDTFWLTRAQNFVIEKKLSDRWYLDWE